MAETMTAYLSPKLEAHPLPEKGFYGVFALEAVEKGELLVMWSGSLYSLENLEQLSFIERSRSVQVENDLFLVPVKQGEPADFINHACNPNAGLNGQIALVAMRDITAGEEICYDYAMSDGSTYDEFECHCGYPDCRHRVTGDDWRLPALQERYQGYFSPYLQRRIEQLRAVQADTAAGGA